MRETDLRVVKTRGTIKSALVELMSEKGLSQITISELSKRANINRKTFYRHYRTIDEVIAELENEILAEFSQILRSDNSSCLDMGAVFRDIGALVERRRDYFAKTMKLNPDVFNRGRLKAMLKRAIEVALKSTGGFSDGVTLSAVSEYIVSGVLALYSDWIDGGCEGSLAPISEIARKMTAGGLLSFAEKEQLSAVRL